ncbi:hypothetical protein [Pedobacter ginsenosidimutans]|nr:hypothetical protein [Pedobacter ginsenosidimutans]
MKRIFMLAISSIFLLNTAFAQTCSSSEELLTVPGTQVDAAHCEWPQQKAHWFDQLPTAANKNAATNLLTKIETLEKESRKSFSLTGCVLKTSFATPPNAKMVYGKNTLLSYDLNLGCYEYFCAKNQLHVNEEYSIVFRAYVNRFTGIDKAYTFADDYPYYETYNKYNGKFIALCDFIRMDNKNVNNGKGYYQDIPESSVKPGNRSTFITRTWYFTKPNTLLFMPVTRKEYLEALLVYYDREGLFIADKIKEIEKVSAGMMKNQQKYPQLYEDGRKNFVIKKAYYPDWQQRIATKKIIVQKALKDNTAQWLAMAAVVKPKIENYRWKNFYGTGPKDYVEIEVYYTDSQGDAEATGSFTFSGFWDDKGGATLYKYNPDYFIGAEKKPADPYMIQLSYRYINTKLGKDLVNNFTEHFDLDAVRNML